MTCPADNRRSDVDSQSDQLETVAVGDTDREVIAANGAQYVDADQARAFAEFAASLRLGDVSLVCRFPTWDKAEAGLFLLGLASSSLPFACLRQAEHGASARVCRDDVVGWAVENVQLCSRCEFDRQAPALWLAFARRCSAHVAESVAVALGDAAGEAGPVPGRTVDMLHRALGAALQLAEIDTDQSVRSVVQQLNAKGAGIDRQRFAPHLRAAREKLRQL